MLLLRIRETVKKNVHKKALKKNVKKKQIASRFVKSFKKIKNNDFGGAAKQKSMDLDCCAARRRQAPPDFVGIFLCPYAFPPSFSNHLETSGGC